MTVDAELIADLRGAVRDVCTDLGGPAAVRTLEPGRAWSEKAWSVLSTQVGIGALGLPESVDGIGGLAEIAAVAEELGAALLPVPFLTSTVMAGQVISRCDVPEVLAEVAAGSATAVLASVVDGVAAAVPDGAGARWLVASEGDALGLVDLAADGVVVEPLSSLDLSRPTARISFPAAARTVLDVDAAAVLAEASAVGRVAVAAESLGGAQRCLDTTVSYVKERRQFGRVIGSFQAVKHTLADLLVQVEMARSAVDRAVEVATTSPDDLDALVEASLVAQIWCSDAYRLVSAEAVQLHGGIGFTWEHDAHLYFRRARANATLLGPVTAARESLAAHLAW